MRQYKILADITFRHATMGEVRRPVPTFYVTARSAEAAKTHAAQIFTAAYPSDSRTSSRYVIDAYAEES